MRRTELRRHLAKTALDLVTEGKGILAMDESNGTCNKRFAALGIAENEPNRRVYRELLLTTPKLSDGVSGAILYDETIRQRDAAGVPFIELMKERGLLVGIKVDTGAKAFAGFDGETVTEGLDGLRERLAEYRTMGAAFAKWRGVLRIDERRLPTDGCVEANAHALARYAALCQEAGIVPIVEPEVLMEGPHDIDRCQEVTSHILRRVFAHLRALYVHLPGVVLKPSMVIQGRQAERKASVEEVAERTLAVLLDCVPASVPGIAFLSGGQPDEDATAHLAAMNQIAPNAPWTLTFSYGRALQRDALDTWRGNAAKVPAAQRALLRRIKANAEAARSPLETTLRCARSLVGSLGEATSEAR